jgi:hypothetical protein
MKIKIRIPTLFAKFRVIKTAGVYVAQVKKDWCWMSIDKDYFAWIQLELEYTALDSVEKAIERINGYRQTVVWSSR